MSFSNPIIAEIFLGDISGTAAAPQISFGGGAGFGSGNSGLGIYGTSSLLGFSIAGSSIGTIDASGLHFSVAALDTITATSVAATSVTTTNFSANSVALISGAGAPVDGTTGLNVAGKGSLYVDKTTPDLYINVGTSAVPAWKLFTRAA